MFFVPNNKKMSFKNTFLGILLAFALLKYVQIHEPLPQPHSFAKKMKFVYKIQYMFCGLFSYLSWFFLQDSIYIHI